jgi:hypothetical protein
MPIAAKPHRSAIVAEAELMRFTSHAAHVKADVKIFSTHVQWSIRGCDDVLRMLPVGAITSTVNRRAMPGKSTLIIASRSGSTAFRVRRAVGEQAVIVLTELVAGLRPAPVNDSIPVLRGSIADELESLKWLRDVGVLSTTELDEQTALVLGCLDPVRATIEKTSFIGHRADDAG